MHPMSGYEIATERHRDSIRTAERYRLARRMRRLRRDRESRATRRPA
jgi:hypothetical protein